MISRQWTGLFKVEHTEAYMQHLRDVLFPKLSNLNGFLGASILRNDQEQAVEFLIITTWETMEAIKAFAGAAPHLAVVPEEVQHMTHSFDKHVRHYKVAYSYPQA